MKTLLITAIRCLLLLAIFVSIQAASAFYDPAVQRWVNRDPIGEAGFRTLIGPARRNLGNQANRYWFVANDPGGKFDVFGLDWMGVPGDPPVGEVDPAVVKRCSDAAGKHYKKCKDDVLKTCNIPGVKESLHNALLAAELGLMDPSNGLAAKGIGYLAGWGLRIGFFGTEVFEAAAKTGCGAQAVGFYAACVIDGGRIP
jgi:hypothetical protein